MLFPTEESSILRLITITPGSVFPHSLFGACGWRPEQNRRRRRGTRGVKRGGIDEGDLGQKDRQRVSGLGVGADHPHHMFQGVLLRAALD